MFSRKVMFTFKNRAFGGWVNNTRETKNLFRSYFFDDGYEDSVMPFTDGPLFCLFLERLLL